MNSDSKRRTLRPVSPADLQRVRGGAPTESITFVYGALRLSDQPSESWPRS